MPKIKTKSAVSKRLKISAQGKFLRRGAFTSHLAASKTSNQKKRLKRVHFLKKADQKVAKLLLPYQKTKFSSSKR